MKERYLADPRLIKRGAESGIQLVTIGEQPVKKIYTSLLQTIVLLESYGLRGSDLPYDLFCPSVQKLAERW